MPDTKPTPTVIDSDKNLAAKWFRCHRPGPCRQAGITTPAHEKLHEDGEAQMAGEIAAAREAWGVSREAVAALVETVEGFRDRDVYAPGHQQRAVAWGQFVAVLERVKEAQG